MRIAISGTHSVGKSTFVNDFVAAHPHYTREEEPYRALCPWYDIKFGKEATRYHNGIQMLYNITRIKEYTSPDDCVIFDRSPVDYLPYSMYPAHYGQTDIDEAFVESLIEPICQSLAFVDILVYMSINEKHLVEIEDDGIRLTDADYRTEVDNYFKEIFIENRFDILPKKNPPQVIELWGSPEERVKKITALLA
jgi:hypothetical protein